MIDAKNNNSEGIKTEDLKNYLKESGKGDAFFEDYDTYSSDKLYDQYYHENNIKEEEKYEDHEIKYNHEIEEEKPAKKGFSFSQMAKSIKSEDRQ
mgnify:CR=1 FL=1